MPAGSRPTSIAGLRRSTSSMARSDFGSTITSRCCRCSYVHVPAGRPHSQDVRIGGGPTIARDFIAAGLVDHIHLVQVPIVLGRGVRLWDGLEALEADCAVEAVSTPSGVTHLTFTR